MTTRDSFERLNGHKGLAVLFTGLSGAGKSSLAGGLHERLFSEDVRSVVLDGDVLRGGLCGDLSFDAVDRQENLRRAAEVARLFLAQGNIVLMAMIAPLESHRQQFATLLGADYREVWCATPLAVCERRDAKGLYARARSGALLDFTGISAPYESPRAPHLVVRSDQMTVAEEVDHLVDWLRREGVIPL